VGCPLRAPLSRRQATGAEWPPRPSGQRGCPIRRQICCGLRGAHLIFNANRFRKRGVVLSGARDQIRTGIPFEVCDLSYSLIARSSPSRWQEKPNPRKINELRVSHRRGAATSGNGMKWRRQTAPRRHRIPFRTTRTRPLQWAKIGYVVRRHPRNKLEPLVLTLPDSAGKSPMISRRTYID